MRVVHNLFTAFYHRNLKPAVRTVYDTLQIARMMVSDPYEGPLPRPRAPWGLSDTAAAFGRQFIPRGVRAQPVSAPRSPETPLLT